MAILGTVVALNGEASVIDEKGIKKPLHLGDVVQPGDTIITPRGVVVELEMVNGRKIQVFAEQTVKFTQELADAIPPDSTDNSVDQATIQAVIKAIGEGRDISEVLEETAAGLGAGGGNSYGFSFVDLLRITEGVTPIGFEFDRSGRNDINIDPLPQPINGLNTTTPGAINNAPVAQNIGIADLEGQPAKTGNLPATDVDGDTLTYTVIGALPPGLTVNPDGSFTFDYSDPAYDVLAAGGTQIISVPFTVNDGKGGTDTATLTITITGTNDAPVATATVVTGDEDASFIPVTLTGTDVDGTVNFVTVTTLPPTSQGTLYLADGTTPVVAGVPLTPAQATGLHFVPAPDFNGNVTIPFTVTDNLGEVSTPSTATITVNPVLDTTTISLSATPSVAEGGSIVYTATLSNAAGSPVTVNLTGGQVITIAAGATTGTVSVAAPTDDVYIDAGTVSKTITGTAGGNFENLVVNSAPATTNVTDTIDVTTVSISGSGSIIEGGTASYTVSLNNPAQTDVTVNLTYSGTAANGSDYTGVATVTILAGQSTANFNLVSTDDNLAEGTENIVVTIGSATGGNFENLAVSGTNGSVTTTLVDNDLPPTITSVEPGAPGVGDDAVPEGTSLVYNVTLSNPSSTPVIYNFTLGGGSSTAGAGDIGSPVFSAGVTNNGNGTITVAPGVTSFSVTVPTTQDTIDEFDETVELTVGGVKGTGTIIDDDNAPTISITGPATIDEAAGTATYTVQLSSLSGKTITVDYFTTNGDAKAGEDYTLTSGTLTFNPGTDTLTFTVPITDDLVTESSEDFTVSLVAPTNASIATGSATTYIIDNEGIPTIANIVGDTQTEGTALTYTVTLSNPSATPVIYAFTVGVGASTASATDIGLPVFGAGVTDNGNGTITVDPGVTGFTVTVPSTQDLVAESNETVELTIGTATGTGTILDNDGAPQISITGPGTVNEAAGTITYTVNLTNPSASTVTVNYASVNGSATAGSDYTAATGSLSFAPGETTKTITVTITDDTVFEGPEDYSISLSAPTNATIGAGSVTTTINDDGTGDANGNPPTDDRPQVASVSSPSTAEGGNLNFVVTLSNASTTPTTVNLTPASGTATLGTDTTTPIQVSFDGGANFTTLAGSSVSVPAGTTSLIVRVPTINDVFAEGNETITLGASTSQNVAPVTGTGTITDTIDTTTISLSATPSVAEGGSIVYTATLSNAAGSPVTVNLTGGQVITIAAGATTGTVSVAAPTDDVYIDAGTVSKTITGTAGGNFENLVVNSAPATTNVTDTIDVTTVSISGSGSIIEGGTASYTVSLNNPAQTDVTVNLTYSGTAANGSDYTGVATVTILAGQSTANFNLVSTDDNLAEGTENIVVTIGSATGGNFENLAVSGTNGSVTTTLVDNDLPPTITSVEPGAPGVGDDAVPEGTSLVYNVTLSNPSSTPVIYNFTLGGGSSTAGAGDIGSPVFSAGVTNNGNGTITVAPGVTSFSVTVPTTQDTIDEFDETVELTVGGVKGTGTIIDDDNAPTISITGPATIDEAAGTATYTVQLSSLSGKTITVDYFTTNGDAKAGEDYTLTSGTLTFNPGTDTLTFTVPITDDLVTESSEDFTVSLVAPTNASIATGSATTYIIDNDTAIVSLSATPSLTEAGGTIVYTATLTQAPVSPLTITLSNGATVIVAAGQLTGTTNVPLAASDDAYIDPTSVSATITGTTGGGITLVIDSTPAVTSITDTIDATTVTLTASAASVVEGGSIVYTATVNNPVTGSPLVVSLNNGQTITIPVGSSSASSAAFAVRADDAYVQGTQTLNVGITGTTGGNYETVTTTSTVSTTVTDDTDATTVTLTASAPTVVEGNTVTYTATLNNAVTGSPLVITLSGGTTITIPVGSSSGTSAPVVVRADDVYAQGTTSVVKTITGTTGGNFEALTTSSTVSTTVTEDSDSTTVTLTASAASVVEGGSIVYTATVNNPVTGSPLVVSLNNGQTITIPVGSSSASSAAFAVRADDAYVQGTQTLNVGITGTTGGNYETVTTTSTVSTTVTDDTDATTVTLTASAPTVVEGNTVTYTATLNNAVTGSPLVITLSGGTTITIPVGSSSGTSAPVVVRADDVYAQGTTSVVKTITGTTGGNFEALTTSSTVSTTVTEDSDSTTVTLTASAASVVEGGSIVYTATVNNPVTGSPLVVSLNNGQTITIPVGSSSASSAAFAVRADDAYVQGTQTLNVGITGTTGGNYETVTTTSTVSTTVTDDTDATTVTLTASAPTVVEGNTVTYTATLNNAVTGSPLVITLSGGTTITIPVGSSSGTSAPVVVRADDVYAQGTTSVVKTITGTTGGNFEALTTSSTVSTTVTEDSDSTTVTLTASAASVVEGGSIVYTATVNNPVTGSPLVVSLNNGQTITIPVGSSSASSAAFAVRADDAYVQGTQTLNVGITGTTGGNYETVTTTSTVSTTVTDDTDATTVTLTASAPTVVEGNTVTYTATLNNAVTGSPLVITLSGGTTITIPVGSSSGTSAPVVVRADDVYAQGTTSVVKTITGTTGGNFEALTTSSTVSTTVTEDSDSTTVSITGTASVTEGGTASYTITLTNPAQTAVTVNLTYSGTASNGSDYTGVASVIIPAGQTSASFNLATINDSLTEPTENLTITIASTSGGSFENLVVSGTNGSVTTTIIDNDAPPVAIGNNNTGLEDATYIVVTLNGTDSDGTVASFNLSSLPANGALYLDAALTQLVPTGTDISASGNALQLYFKPAADFNTLAGGPLSFNFTAKDDTGLVSPTATETITVTAVNDGAPVTAADNYSTVLGTPIIISKASLLSNDTLFDHAQITSITPLSGTGTLVDNGNGTYTYTPAATGSRNFTYTVTDDDGQTSTSTVTLTTYNTRDDLATVNESALAEGNGGGARIITGNLLANDAGNTSVTSLTGATLSGGVYTASSPYGTLQVTAATGAYTYTLNNNVDNDTQSGATNTGYMDTFTYTGNSTGNGTPINLRVNIVDDAPTATNATVVVAEASLQAFNIVMMLDVSGSMTEASNGGQVRDVADDGSATIATRLAMAKAGMIALVEEYFSQSSSVTITLATFSTASQINGTYTSKDAAITAINGLTGSGGTNYEAALNTIKTAFGTPSQSVSNISYFISDGAPNGGNTTDPVGASGFGTFATNNHIQSYAIGIGSGIATTAPLNAIHNVDADGSGTADAAIIVADLNKLETALISTVPHAFGGNVVTSGGASNVTFGADGGFIRYIDLMLDSDGNGTADQSVRFTYNAATHQISTNGSFVTGFPVSGDSMTLGAAQGFVNGKLVFDFSTGDYKYFTEGQGVEGTQFDIGFQVMDNDGDTANAVQTVMVVDGKPVAYNDFDTLLPNSTSFEGNVITSAGTDGSTGALVTSFTAASSGADLIVDNAAITSITFKGVVYNLTANSSGTASGGTYTISNGHLTWTSSTEPANQLVFDKDGYYKYTPPAVQTATATPDAAVTTLFNTSANATANGVTLSGVSRTGNVNSPNATLTYNDPNGTANDGVGINSGGSNAANANVDNLETLIIRFNSATHPQGVQNVIVNVSAAQSNLGSGSGTVVSLTYSIYDISGNLLGQFASFAEGNVAIPSIYGNIGYIEVEANSAASARISSVTFNSSNVNTTAIGYAPEDISYTLTDSDGDASTATLKLSTTTNHYAGGAAADNITGSAANDYITGGDGNDTLNGGAGYDIIIGGAGNDSIDGGADNDQLYGGDGNDTINGGTGNDLIYGGAGNDIINGGDGADTIYGGAGNDVINGGLGADTIYGGAGNDTLTGGGVGVDVFKWELTDQGAKGAPAADVITDFNAASVAAGGDVLDLRDLLVGENHDVGAGNLASFLHFEKSGADTIVHISSNGEFAAGFNSAKEVQTITLTGVDLVGSFTNDQQIVQDLLSKQKLVTD